MSTHFDIAVIGGGLAGLTAAHHAAHEGATVAHILGLEPVGGLVCNVGALAGFPSVGQQVSGIELALSLASSNGILGVTEIRDDARSLARTAGGFRIGLSDDGAIGANQVIAATGARLRVLDVPGARELAGRGISQCGWCDGALYKGKDLVVVGGGDAAIEEALHLSRFARNLTIVTRGDGFRARQAYVNKIADLDNVEFRWMSTVVEIIGSDGVEAIRVFNREEGAAEEIACSGVFVFVGLEPNSQLLVEHAELDPLGAVLTGESMQTATPGLFAIGAVRSGYRGRLVHAVGEAATAAMFAVARSSQ